MDVKKDELVDAVIKICGGNGLSKRLVNEILDVTFQTIARAVKKEKRFVYPGVGTFMVRTRKARTGRNPQTGEAINIKASKTVGFKPAPAFKNSL